MYGQKDLFKKNIFSFDMQADDISNESYDQDNVFHCICLF